MKTKSNEEKGEKGKSNESGSTNISTLVFSPLPRCRIGHLSIKSLLRCSETKTTAMKKLEKDKYRKNRKSTSVIFRSLRPYHFLFIEEAKN